MAFESIAGAIRWLFFAHALAGLLALAVFSIPLITKKGGKNHVRSGWLYIAAMTFVALSAFVITPWRVFLDTARTVVSQSFAFFLFFISVFTLSGMSFGIRALRLKKRQGPARGLAEIGPPLAVILLGAVAQAIGVATGDTLLMVFPIVAYFTSAGQLGYWLRAPVERMHWWYAHMSGMLTACIATITAFLVTAGPRIWPELSGSLWVWVTPGLVLGSGLTYWTTRYRRQFGD